MKKWVKGLLILMGGVVLFLSFFTFMEYRPQDIELLTLGPSEALDKDEITLLSYNIGYGGLGKEQDFFMDGGKSVRPSSRQVVETYLAGILEEIKKQPADFYLLQEVDIQSKRSYDIDEKAFLEGGLGLEGSFAANYKALYVPYPFPPIGHVHSGLLTLSSYVPSTAYRKSLPVPFSWPVRTVNLKRCLLVEEYALKDSDKKFVLINLHLEAFDDGEGKIRQSQELLRLAQQYFDQGHYVLAGGDWNQTFPGSDFPQLSETFWKPGVLLFDGLPQGWRYISDPSTASSRSNHEAYQGSGHQVYGIDGYLASPNIEEISVKTLDYGFAHSDHHPVKLVIRLKK